MSKIKVTWAGATATRMPLEKGGEKVLIKPGQVFEMEDSIAKSINQTYKQLLLGEHEVEAKENAPEGGETDLSKLKRPELVAIAKELGVEVGAKSTIVQLVEAIEAATKEAAEIKAELASLGAVTVSIDGADTEVATIKSIATLREILEEAKADATPDDDGKGEAAEI